MKTLLTFLFVLAASAAQAASIQFTLVQGGFGNLSKTYTLSDAEMVRIIAAYQSGANVAVNGTATRAQVLQFWLKQFIQETATAVQQFETPKIVVPAPIDPQ